MIKVGCFDKGEEEWERELGFQCEGWSAPGLSSQPTAFHYHTGSFV